MFSAQVLFLFALIFAVGANEFDSTTLKESVSTPSCGPVDVMGFNCDTSAVADDTGADIEGESDDCDDLDSLIDKDSLDALGEAALTLGAMFTVLGLARLHKQARDHSTPSLPRRLSAACLRIVPVTGVGQSLRQGVGQS